MLGREEDQLGNGKGGWIDFPNRDWSNATVFFLQSNERGLMQWKKKKVKTVQKNQLKEGQGSQSTFFFSKLDPYI